MPKGRKPGMRMVDYRSYPFSFRLTDAETDKRYLDLMNEWVAQAEGAFKTHKVANVIKGLIHHFAGFSPVQTEGARVDIDIDALKAEIMSDLKGWVRDLIADSGRMETLVDAHEQTKANGGDVPDDVVDNILADFMNEGG